MSCQSLPEQNMRNYWMWGKIFLEVKIASICSWTKQGAIGKTCLGCAVYLGENREKKMDWCELRSRHRKISGRRHVKEVIWKNCWSANLSEGWSLQSALYPFKTLFLTIFWLRITAWLCRIFCVCNMLLASFKLMILCVGDQQQVRLRFQLDTWFSLGAETGQSWGPGYGSRELVVCMSKGLCIQLPNELPQGQSDRDPFTLLSLLSLSFLHITLEHRVLQRNSAEGCTPQGAQLYTV